MTNADTARIRAEIAATRAEVGQTVTALSARLDVKARARVKRAEIVANIRQAGAEAQANAVTFWHERPEVVVGTGAAGGALLVFLLVRKVRG
ncbi:MAG TPA: DUF3618 domain-containing protein [Mycobacteriales bacterium]|jgi:ElaB/YqjD/DUF883 family membrane-anchored ribosome-binding protein|nr:DUF3618 domain-containing protein [Mycobacteriales bacterium]